MKYHQNLFILFIYHFFFVIVEIHFKGFTRQRTLQK